MPLPLDGVRHGYSGAFRGDPQEADVGSLRRDRKVLCVQEVADTHLELAGSDVQGGRQVHEDDTVHTPFFKFGTVTKRVTRRTIIDQQSAAPPRIRRVVNGAAEQQWRHVTTTDAARAASIGLAEVALPPAQLQRVVDTSGACIAWGGALALAPADDILITVASNVVAGARSAPGAAGAGSQVTCIS